MQLQFFSIPASGDSMLVEEVNTFLRTHRVIAVHKELAQRDTAPAWCICVEYLDSSPSGGDGQSKRKSRIDYKQILSEDDFTLFSRLRELRKKMAEAEAVPVYAICTNEQLADMARNRPASIKAIKKIPGFGDAKTKKYGSAFIKIITETTSDGVDDETSGKPD